MTDQTFDAGSRTAETEQLLFRHFNAHPEMTPQDAVKLLFQNAFGAEHIITDQEKSLAALRMEYDATPAGDLPLAEPVGNGRARLSLAAVKRRLPGLTAETVGRIFVLGANERPDETAEARFFEHLQLLKALAEQGKTPFSPESLAEYTETCQPDMKNPPRHSEAYRTASRPAYRLVRECFLPFLSLLAGVDRALSGEDKIVIGVDGRCASGKSTLAGMLADVYGGAVLRADDFFLPGELRTEARLGTPGGNIHYERFLREAAPGLREKKPFSYRVFDCAAMEYRRERSVFRPGRVSVVDGSYSLREDFRHLYDVTVFLTVGKREQKQRIAVRNGEMLQTFLDCWIPMEETYFRASGIRNAADFVIDTGRKIRFEI